MRTVYVTQKGAIVRRDGVLLQVYAERRKLAEVPVRELDQLVLMGNVTLTPAALDLLVEQGVDTVFLTLHGKYRGRIAHSLSANVRLRLSQYRKLSCETEAMRTAAGIVTQKIANMRTFLMKFARRHGSTPAIERATIALRAAMARVSLADTLDGVRGCEGSAAAAYFRAFSDLLRAEGLHFDGRNRRPPLDPVNALLSLGYTLLANAVQAAVEIVGLDPYVGALHAVETGRPSLVCDLMEEFRTPVVDAIVVAALNRHVFQVDDFEDTGPGEPVLIRREAMGTFVRTFEQRMASEVLYSPFGKRLSYRHVIEQQARQFARYVLGTEERYRPFATR
jgi:CRISPR-associated protein Cas1